VPGGDDNAPALALRLKYVLSPIGLVDLLAVAPFWIGLISAADLRVFLVFRMVRFLKLARYSPGMRSLLDAMYAERRALFGCLVIITGATLVAASIMQAIEGPAQPDKLGRSPTRCGGRSSRSRPSAMATWRRSRRLGSSRPRSTSSAV
jgi:hypothetical protein